MAARIRAIFNEAKAKFPEAKGQVSCRGRGSNPQLYSVLGRSTSIAPPIASTMAARFLAGFNSVDFSSRAVAAPPFQCRAFSSVASAAPGSAAGSGSRSGSYRLTVVPGDGIGPEITKVALDVLHTIASEEGIKFELQEKILGGVAIDNFGTPLPDDTLAACKDSDAVLLSAIGGYKWDNNEPHLRPERGLLTLRAAMGVFANLRPAVVIPQLVDSSTLKREVAAGVDIMVVRELTGGIYFGQPKGFGTNSDGEEIGFNTEVYAVSEIERIARVGFEIAGKRTGRLCSIDKANILEASQLWRRTVTRVAKEYPDIELKHMLVDNAAMQLIRDPKQFDTIVTNNIFGDILSDEASMLTGSIGMLPSASVQKSGPGLFEPVHGSAPDIAGQDKANPLAMILSVAMLLKYGLGETKAAERIEKAVLDTLEKGFRTGDIMSSGMKLIGCAQMGEEVINTLREGQVAAAHG